MYSLTSIFEIYNRYANKKTDIVLYGFYVMFAINTIQITNT